MKYLAVLVTLLASFLLPSTSVFSHPAAAADTSCQSISSVPNLSDQTVNLPAGMCFDASAPLVIQNATNLTINGNGDTVNSSSTGPLLDLWNDTNVTINDVNLSGQATSGGVSSEGYYGVKFEGDTNVTLDGDSVSNVAGDFLYLSPPYDVDSVTDSLNKNITVTNSTFTNAGYHGVTVESVDGLNINHDTFTNIGVDAFDLEYDIYSTPFNPDGTPYWDAEDNVVISDNTFDGWSGDWFSSIQGQTPGVQEQHVTITGNTLIGTAPLFEVIGTEFSQTQAQSYNIWFTVKDNTLEGAARPVHGGSIADQYPGEGAMYFQSVAGLDMENNNFPLFDGTCDPPASYSYFCNTPYAAALDLQETVFTAIKNNNFGGALGVLNPDSSSYTTFFADCGNAYGLSSSEPACP